eukprot:g28245.t1
MEHRQPDASSGEPVSKDQTWAAFGEQEAVERVEPKPMQAEWDGFGGAAQPAQPSWDAFGDARGDGPVATTEEDTVEQGGQSEAEQTLAPAHASEGDSEFGDFAAGPSSPEALDYEAEMNEVTKVGAVLKESNYKAGGAYLSEYKQLLIEKGKPWTHQLQRMFTQVTRARGPTKKAAEVPEDLWMEKCRKEVNETKAGQIHNPALMFAFATVWMLREVELAAIYKEDITIEEKGSIVALNLRITKGDQEGLGVKRTLQCCCEEAKVESVNFLDFSPPVRPVESTSNVATDLPFDTSSAPAEAQKEAEREVAEPVAEPVNTGLDLPDLFGKPPSDVPAVLAMPPGGLPVATADANSILATEMVRLVSTDSQEIPCMLHPQVVRVPEFQTSYHPFTPADLRSGDRIPGIWQNLAFASTGISFVTAGNHHVCRQCEFTSADEDWASFGFDLSAPGGTAEKEAEDKPSPSPLVFDEDGGSEAAEARALARSLCSLGRFEEALQCKANGDILRRLHEAVAQDDFEGAIQIRSEIKALGHSLVSDQVLEAMGSDSEVESESSEEDPQDLTQQNYCPGQLLQALTSKWKGHTEKMVVQIIRSGVDINEKLTEPWDPGFANFKQTVGAEPLHFAACTALLECNADIDAQTNTGVSALMVAVMFNRLDVARLLVDAKASVLRQDQNGLSVTDIAILEGNPQMVQMLLEREKQEDEEMEAEVMQGAIDAGADISLLPPVDKSLALDEQEILRQMLKKGS